MNKSRTAPVIASMKTNLIAVAVAAVSLTSFAAFADDCDQPGNHGNHHHAVRPSAPAGQHGRYELRNTQKYVQGHYENVTVQECREKRHGWRRGTVCRPVTTSQWIPGGFQTVQEWVWVPSHRPQQYSQYPGQRPPMYSGPGVGFHVSIR